MSGAKENYGRIGTEIDWLDWREGQSGTIEIYDICVNSERGKGKGTEMLQQLKAMFPKSHIYAFAREENHLASNFYKKNNFTSVCLIPNFYTDGNAILYLSL